MIDDAFNSAQFKNNMRQLLRQRLSEPQIDRLFERFDGLDEKMSEKMTNLANARRQLSDSQAGGDLDAVAQAQEQERVALVESQEAGRRMQALIKEIAEMAGP